MGAGTGTASVVGLEGGAGMGTGPAPEDGVPDAGGGGAGTAELSVGLEAGTEMGPASEVVTQAELESDG